MEISLGERPVEVLHHSEQIHYDVPAVDESFIVLAHERAKAMVMQQREKSLK